jgi:hypothetical protein
MRTFRLPLLAAALLLAACGAPARYPSPQTLERNPLFVYARASLLVQHLTDIEIAGKAASGSLATYKQAAMRAAQDAQADMSAGWLGTFVPAADDVMGSALLLPGTLFIGPSFVMPPTPVPHVYVSGVVDPRDGDFPDATAVDLGPLPSPFGAMVFPLPAGTAVDGTLRTVVIYDQALDRLVGFAQLEKAAM